MRFLESRTARVKGIGIAVVCLALLPRPAAAQAGVASRSPIRPAPRGAPTHPLPVPQESEGAPARRGYIVESGPVSFGDVLPGVGSEIPGAIRVRVWSDRDWVLRLVAISPLRTVERSEPVPLSRLAWRSRRSGGFVPLSDDRSATVARGSATGGAGEVVVVDVRFSLGPSDGIGRYSCDLRLLLEDG